MNTIERELCERVFTCDKRPAAEIPVSADGVALFPGTRFFLLQSREDSASVTVVTVILLQLAAINGKPTILARVENAAHSGAIGANTFDVEPGRLYFHREKALDEVFTRVPQPDAGNVAPFAHWKRRDAKGGA